MATVAAVVFEHHLKEDGTFNIKIRISQKGKSAYIDTPHYVTKSQLDKKYKIKDQFVLGKIPLATYRDRIAALPESLTAQEIKAHLTDQKDEQIDFLVFCKGLITKMRKEGRAKTAVGFQSVLNALEDFSGSSLPVSSINALYLKKFETFLLTPREIKRNNRAGAKAHVTISKTTASGVHNYMRDLRTMFNVARDQYNDEDRGIIRIANYPFKKYKIAPAPATKKRALTVEQLIAIRDSQPITGRGIMAKDLFMLSFYLLGMNAADMYQLKPGTVKRVEYYRAKTKGKRKDRAFISVKLPDVAQAIYKTYAGTLQKRYSNPDGLNKALSFGIKELRELVGFEFEFYSARHSVGTIARNELRFSKDDIGEALNHVDGNNSTTDIYIAKSWEVLDRVQEGLIGLLSKC